MTPRRIVVTFVGFEPFWMRFLTDELNALYGDRLECSWRVWPSNWSDRLQFLRAMVTSDVVVRVGMPFEFESETNALWLRWIASRRRVTGVNYWIGSDVRIYLERLKSGLTSRNDAKAVRELVHFAGAENLTAALRNAGVPAETVVVPSPERPAPPRPTPLPEEFSVLTYWSDANYETNGGPAVLDAARLLPDVEFEVMGTMGIGLDAPANVTFLGHVDDVEKHYDKASVVVRVPVWDSVPSAVVEEALFFGRHVIYSFEFPHTLHVGYGDASSLAGAIAGLHDQHAAGRLAPNVAGREFIEQYGASEPRWKRMAEAIRGATGHGNKVHALLVGQAKWTRLLALGLNEHTDVEADAVPIDTVRDAFGLLSARRFRRADVIMRVGFRPGAHTTRGALFDAIFDFMRPRRTPVVYYWLGTDVLNLRHDIETGADQRRFRRMADGATHVADSDALGRDLRELGIESATAWLPAPNAPQQGDVQPMPAKFTVLSYVPDARSTFYDGPTIIDVARRMPEVAFRVVGGSGAWLQSSPLNVEFLGWCDDMSPLYDQSSVLVRLVEHDSTSCMTVEALAHGRPVVYSREFPNTVHVGFQDADGLEGALRGLIDAGERGASGLPDDAVTWARTIAEPRACYGEIANILTEASVVR